MERTVANKSSSWSPTASAKTTENHFAPLQLSIGPDSESKSSSSQKMPIIDPKVAEWMAEGMRRSLLNSTQPSSESAEQETARKTGEIGLVQRFLITSQAPKTAPVHPIQAQMTIGKPGEQHEQEADRAASQVVQRLHAPRPDLGLTYRQPSNELVQRIRAKAQQQRTENWATNDSLFRRFRTANSAGVEMSQSGSGGTKEGIVQRLCNSCESELSQEKQQKEIQTKLTIGQPGDKYEREADSVAATIMSMAEPSHNQSIQREIDPYKEEQEQTLPLARFITPLVQRNTESEENFQNSSNLEHQLNGSKGGGSPLSDGVRGFMESRFGADFSGVRVHTDSAAVQMNRQLNAQAFTHGSDIYFGAGKSPGNNELTAHELTHVVQQTGNANPGQPSTPVQRQGKGSGAKPKNTTTFKVENKTYTVTAKTLQEAADQISQREEAGETTWNPKFNLKTDESGNVTDATVDVTITVTLPNWPNTTKLSKAAKAEWDRAFGVLKKHEENHVQLVRDKLKDMAKSLVGKSQAEAEAIFQKALTELQQASDNYDASSDHGRNEGTDLDTSVEAPPSVQPALQRSIYITIQRHADHQIYLGATANTIQRDKNENSDVNQQDLIKKAIESKDPGDVKAINPFRFNLASIDDRFRLLDILLNHNSFIGPRDAYAIEKIWNSFGKDLGEVASKHLEVWNQCNSHTLVNLESLPELVGMKLQFKQAVAARARGYLEDNKKLVKSELERLGLDNPNAPATAEQSGNVAEIVKVAKLVKDAQKARVKLGWVDVGYRHPTVTIRPSQKVPVKFNPFNLNFKPELPPYGTENPPMPTWDKTKEVYDKISAIIDGYSEKYPAIFVLIRDNKIDEVAQGNDQAKIRQTIAKPLQDTFDNILKTEPLLSAPGSDFPLELEPIHQQFFKSQPPWNLPFQKSIANKAIEEHGNQKFWETIGVGTMQLALFIVAEFTTGGLATFFLIAGAITSAGQAAESWQKYDQTQSAANTNLSKETALISQDQANHALGEAILTTVFAFLDLYGAGKALSAEVKGLKASKLASVEAQEAKRVAEATETANKSAGKLRNEFKVEKTATGETHEFKFLKDGTIRRCSDEPCNILIDSFKARADKALNELAADSPLRQQAEALSNQASAIQKEYGDLVKKVEKLPSAERESLLTAGEAPIRQRLEKTERAMADLEVQVGAGGAKSFSKTVSYGKNYLEKFRKHAEQIRRTTGNEGIGKVSSAEGQKQIKAVIEDIVMSGETRQRRYMTIPDALWSRKGDAIVIRQANGEFVTFLEAGKGAALGWGN